MTISTVVLNENLETLEDKKNYLKTITLDLHELYKKSKKKDESTKKLENSIILWKRDILKTKNKNLNKLILESLLKIQKAFWTLNTSINFRGEVDELYRKGNTLLENSSFDDLDYIKDLTELNKKFTDSRQGERYYSKIVSFKNHYVPEIVKWLIDVGVNFENLNHIAIHKFNKALTDTYENKKPLPKIKVQLIHAKMGFFLILLRDYQNLLLSTTLDIKKILLAIVHEVSLRDLSEWDSEQSTSDTDRDMIRLFHTTSLFDKEFLSLCDTLKDENRVTVKFLGDITHQLCQDRQKAFLWQTPFITHWNKYKSAEIDAEETFDTKSVLKKRENNSDDIKVFNNFLEAIPSSPISSLGIKLIYTSGNGSLTNDCPKVYTVITNLFDQLDIWSNQISKKNILLCDRISLEKAQWIALGVIAQLFKELLNPSPRELDYHKTLSGQLGKLLLSLHKKIVYYDGFSALTTDQESLLKRLTSLYIEGVESRSQANLLTYHLDHMYYFGAKGTYKSFNDAKSYLYWLTLVRDTSLMSLIKKIFGIDIETQLFNMESEIYGYGTIPDESKKDRITTLRLSQCQLILPEITTALGKKRRLLQENYSPEDSEYKIIENEVAILEKAFDHFLNLHKSLKPPTTSFWWKIMEELFCKVLNDLSIYYVCGCNAFKYTPTAIYEFKKQWADLGYDAEKDLRKFFGFLFSTNGDESFSIYSIIQNIAGMVRGWRKFATNHPEKAELMASDLVISILPFLNQSEVDDLIVVLKTHQYYNALTSSLMDRYVVKEVTIDDFPYIALSQLTHSFPTFSAGLKTLIETRFEFSFSYALNLTVNAIKNFSKVQLLQNAAEICTRTPEIVTDLVTATLEIINGKDLHSIIEGQTRLATIRLISEIWRAFQNPKEFMIALKREFAIWWSTLWNFESYLELACRIVTQIIIPIATIATAINLFVVVLASGGIWLALAFFTGTIIFGFSLSLKSYSLINYFTGTREKIETNLFKQASKTEEIFQNHAETQSEKYISELKEKCALPKLDNTMSQETKDDLKVIVDKWTETIESDMNEEESIQSFKNPKDYCMFFSKHLDQKSLRKKLEEEEGLEEERLYQAAALITNELETNWLKPRVENLLRAKMQSDIDSSTLSTEDLEKGVVESYEAEYRDVIKDQGKLSEFMKGKLQEKTNANDEQIDGVWQGYQNLIMQR